MSANYDNSAWFYDRLSRLIYGRAIVNSQLFLVQHIPPNSSVLIVGGGTGWILDEIAKIHPSGLNITYVEVSAKMIALSKKRHVAGNQIIYINEPIENLDDDITYDVVFTPFLFDNFTEDTLHNIFRHIHQKLKAGGIWLNDDFQLTGKLWQEAMLKSMFILFRLMCGIEAKELPHIRKQFKQYGYLALHSKTFFDGFILAEVYATNNTIQ